jgi:hypothetical protein
MLSKLVVFGAGYVLGSKAGRERYDQIVALTKEMARRLDEYGGQSWFPAGSPWSSSREGSSSRGQTRA